GDPVSHWSQLRDVLYEDEAVLVLNKPAGLSVMGERHETDLVRIAEEAGETLYPVHRIDKVTSGALLLAKELSYHGDLTRQFNKRSVEKVYLAVTRSTGLPERGTIDLPLSVGRKSRVRVAANREAITFAAASVAAAAPAAASGDAGAGAGARWFVPPDEQFQHVKTYPSVSTFERLWADERHTLLAVHPVT